MTPYNVIPVLLILGLIFVPLGIVFLHTSNGVQEITMDYTWCLKEAPTDDWARAPSAYGAFEWRRLGEDRCGLRFRVPRTMEGPVVMYYRLTNYYQNQRMYVKSVEWDQLGGKALPRASLGACDPLVGPDEDRLVYYPCGLIANSYFSDTLGDPKGESSGQVYSFPPSGIAWESDAKRFQPTAYTKEQVRAPPFWQAAWPDKINPDGSYKDLPDLSTDERFWVWMRVAGFPTFRKPWGKRSDPLPAGTYSMEVTSVFDVASYGATKSVVFSTTSWMGGKNPFLGTLYIVVGSVFIGAALLFLLKHLVSPRPLGDLRYLSWMQRDQAAA